MKHESQPNAPTPTGPGFSPLRSQCVMILAVLPHRCQKCLACLFSVRTCDEFSSRIRRFKVAYDFSGLEGFRRVLSNGPGKMAGWYGFCEDTQRETKDGSSTWYRCSREPESSRTDRILNTALHLLRISTSNKDGPL